VSALDRRLDRRKTLPADFPVELYPQELADGGPALVGRAVDLTMGGIGVLVAEPFDQLLHVEVWTVGFALPDKSGQPVPISLNCVVTHGRPHPDGHLYGLKFHEINAPGRSAERAALRQYLLSDLRSQWRGNLMLQPPSVSA
jgi:c-di-GMP-binding flagellar brake protein YcgR